MSYLGPVLLIVLVPLSLFVTVTFVLKLAKNPALPRQNPRKFMLLVAAFPAVAAVEAAIRFAAGDDLITLAFAIVFAGLTVWALWWAIKPPKIRPEIEKATAHKHVSSHVQEVRLRASRSYWWLVIGGLAGVALAMGPDLVQNGPSGSWLIVTVLTLTIMAVMLGLGFWLMPMIMVRLFDHFHARKPAGSE